MQIRTTRFGLLEAEGEDLIEFPSGLLGLEDCRAWLLLADAENEALGWLQSATRPEVALAVVSPRRFVPDYELRVYRRELRPLRLDTLDDAQVLAIVSRHDAQITLNLRAPIVVNLSARLGRQVVANGDASLRYELTPVELKKTA